MYIMQNSLRKGGQNARQTHKKKSKSQNKEKTRFCKVAKMKNLENQMSPFSRGTHICREVTHDKTQHLQAFP